MSIAEKFQRFCSNLRMSDDVVVKVSSRYYEITRRLNESFRGCSSGDS